VLAAFSAIVALYLGFFAFEPEVAVVVVKHSGYWLIFTAFILFLFNLGHCLRGRWQVLGRSMLPLPALLLVVLSSVVLLLSQPADYKIVMDEPILSSTALQMHLEKQAMTATRGHMIGGAFNLVESYVDKRPIFYPFLVSLLHDLTGFRSMQGAVLNALLLPFLLVLLFVSGRMLTNRDAGGYLAMGLSMTVPLLAMNANSAGFDLLNLVMILVALLAACCYMQQPDASHQNAFIFAAVLLAQTRYESALYIAPVALIVFYVWWREGKVELSKAALFVPLLLISVPLKNLILKGYPLLWEVKEHGGAPFMLRYIPENLGHAADYFFALPGRQPNSLFLSVLFCICLLFLVVLIIRRRIVRPEYGVVWLLFALGMVASFLLLMIYHWGQIDDILATRIVLPFLLFQVLFATWGLGQLPDRWRVLPVMVGMTLCVFFAVSRPHLLSNSALWWVDLSSSIRWQREKYIQYRDSNPLFVANYLILATAEKVAAISWDEAVDRKRELDLHQKIGTFGEILFLEYCLVEETRPGERELVVAVDRHFEREVLEEFRHGDGHYMQLSRLKSVHFEQDEPMSVIDAEVLSGSVARDKLFVEMLP
jgi:hypothetical protein